MAELTHEARIWERIDELAAANAGVRETLAELKGLLQAYHETSMLRLEALRQELDGVRQRTLENRTEERKQMGAMEVRLESLEGSRAKLIGFAAGVGLGAGGLGGALVAAIGKSL